MHPFARARQAVSRYYHRAQHEPIEIGLIAYGSATFDASGAATIRITATGSLAWIVERYATTTTSTAGTKLTVYRGDPNAVNVIDYTRLGNGDVSENNPPIQLSMGEYMTFVYRGGTVGALATIRIEGRRRVPATASLG